MANPQWIDEPARCPCCTSSETRLPAFASPDRFFGGSRHYSYGECLACKAVYLLHEGWTFAEAYPSTYPAYGVVPRLRWFHIVVSGYFFPRVPRDALEPVVEIGAGTGLFLTHLLRQHSGAIGYEPDEQAVNVASKAGLPIRVGFWESLDLPAGGVGTLVMNQVIEHLVQPPAEVFARAHHLLKPGGLWVIRTPNAGSWGRDYFGACWHPLETPRHTVVYGVESIQHLARRHRFHVVAMRHCGRAYDLTQSATYAATENRTGVLSAVFRFCGPLFPFSRAWAAACNLLRRGEAMEFTLRKIG